MGKIANGSKLIDRIFEHSINLETKSNDKDVYFI